MGEPARRDEGEGEGGGHVPGAGESGAVADGAARRRLRTALLLALVALVVTVEVAWLVGLVLLARAVV